MDNEKRDRYKFSLIPPLTVLDEEVIEERGQQGILFYNELVTYNVLLKDLATDEVPYSLRNLLLNMALYIMKDIEIFQKFENDKEIPYIKVCKEFRRTKSFIDKWRDYIIAYVVLLRSDEYNYIQDYIRVIEDDNINDRVTEVSKSKGVIHDLGKHLKDEKEDNLKSQLLSKDEDIRGVVLKVKGKNALILTSQGDFKKVKLHETARLGEEVEGKVRKKLKDYKFYIAMISVLVVIAISFGVFQYTHAVRTIMINTATPIVMKVNTFNRVASISSKYSEAQKIIDKINVKDKDMDIALYNILKYIRDNKLMTNQGVSITVNGKAIEYGTLLKSQEYARNEQMDVRFNNAGVDNKFY